MRPGRPPGAGSVSRRRRPNARDGGGSADVCVYLLTSSFCLRGISFVYGGSVVSPTKKIHNFVYGGSVSSTGDQFRLRGISLQTVEKYGKIRKFLFSPCLASDGCRILAARIRVRRGTRYGMGLRRRSVGGGALLNERSRGTSRTRESRYRPDGLASSASGRRIRTACGKTAERSSSTSWRACESVRGFEGRRPPAD
ncbi:hypothetical protein NP493_6669g00002 [Ridgeia piscesae]|uniref:Uncharacterized protein n=1 Tax=Ridgeia piscesae TaxID=27915 RepID=A0AAD9IQR0_RIDPI|nr:hypothetical protein NP493_6669g00002 [Ridgeia piscesae]